MQTTASVERMGCGFLRTQALAATVLTRHVPIISVARVDKGNDCPPVAVWRGAAPDIGRHAFTRLRSRGTELACPCDDATMR